MAGQILQDFKLKIRNIASSKPEIDIIEEFIIKKLTNISEAIHDLGSSLLKALKSSLFLLIFLVFKNS